MYTRTVTERVGSACGPIDWSHPTAKDMPEIWKEAEKEPDKYLLENGGWLHRRIYQICMYDGWPYWKPTPAICFEGPLGPEWAFFDSYGIHPTSIRKKST